MAIITFSIDVHTTGGHEMLPSDTLTIMENAKSHGVRIKYDIQPTFRPE